MCVCVYVLCVYIYVCVYVCVCVCAWARALVYFTFVISRLGILKLGRSSGERLMTPPLYICLVYILLKTTGREVMILIKKVDKDLIKDLANHMTLYIP